MLCRPQWPELTTLSWLLQVDSQTEENDMNKRRRKGFHNLDEVRVYSVSLNQGPLPASQQPQAHLTVTAALALPSFLLREPLMFKLGLMEKVGSGPPSTTKYLCYLGKHNLLGCGSHL